MCSHHVAASQIARDIYDTKCLVERLKGWWMLVDDLCSVCNVAAIGADEERRGGEKRRCSGRHTVTGEEVICAGTPIKMSLKAPQSSLCSAAVQNRCRLSSNLRRRSRNTEYRSVIMNRATAFCLTCVTFEHI